MPQDPYAQRHATYLKFAIAATVRTRMIGGMERIMLGKVRAKGASKLRWKGIFGYVVTLLFSSIIETLLYFNIY